MIVVLDGVIENKVMRISVIFKISTLFCDLFNDACSCCDYVASNDHMISE
jgi:hypothetical protein